MTQFTIENWKPFRKNTMQGSLDLVLPSGIILRGCTLHEKNGDRWIRMPARSYTNDSGATTWVTTVEFASKEAKRRFQETALEAVDRHLRVAA
jgi:hypothetical protein